jgi:hypothetical protein
MIFSSVWLIIVQVEDFCFFVWSLFFDISSRTYRPLKPVSFMSSALDVIECFYRSLIDYFFCRQTMKTMLFDLESVYCNEMCCDIVLLKQMHDMQAR